MSAPDYLQNAAAVWAMMLRELRPDYDWTVEVRQVDGVDAVRGSAAGVLGHETGAVLQHAHPLFDGHDSSAATSARDNDGLQQAA